MLPRLAFLHRGFVLTLRPSEGGGGFGYVIEQDAQALHASGPVFGTAVAAERAARRFVDDALTAFECATQALAG